MVVCESCGHTQLSASVSMYHQEDNPFPAVTLLCKTFNNMHEMSYNIWAGLNQRHPLNGQIENYEMVFVDVCRQSIKSKRLILLRPVLLSQVRRVNLWTMGLIDHLFQVISIMLWSEVSSHLLCREHGGTDSRPFFSPWSGSQLFYILYLHQHLSSK